MRGQAIASSDSGPQRMKPGCSLSHYGSAHGAVIMFGSFGAPSASHVDTPGKKRGRIVVRHTLPLNDPGQIDSHPLQQRDE